MDAPKMLTETPMMAGSAGLGTRNDIPIRAKMPPAASTAKESRNRFTMAGVPPPS